MEKITAAKYSNDLLVLGFDGHIYKNENGSWTNYMKRDLSATLKNLYNMRHTLKLHELRDQIVNTPDINLDKDINIHYLGANQYYEISKMLLALEILQSYKHDPFDYLKIPIYLGPKETDLEKLLFDLKNEEIENVKELYDITTAYIGLSYNGTIVYDIPALRENKEQIVYTPDKLITYDEYTSTRGLVLYNCFMEFLERNGELDPVTKARIRSYSFGPDSTRYYTPDIEFFESSRIMITVPKHCLPQEHQLYFIKHNTKKILEVIDALANIVTPEQYIKHHLDNGMGLYSILKQTFNLLWPRNNLNEVLSSHDYEYNHEEYPGVPQGNLDMMNDNNKYGIMCYCLLEHGICTKVETFATYFF